MKPSRRKTRRFLVQYLYAQWAQHETIKVPEQLGQFEDNKDFLDEVYFEEAKSYITDNLPHLLGIIQHFGPKFEVAQLPIVNLTIILVALYEFFGTSFEDIPPRVTINEAIELAKKYSDPASKNFINGLLNSVYEKKEDIEKKKLSIEPIEVPIF